MTAPDAPRHHFRIDPIRRLVVEDPDVQRTLEHVCQAVGIALPPAPPVVVGWQLTLCADDNTIEQREFDGAEHGFDDAQRAGGAWLAEHGQDSLSQWLAAAAQSSRRMAWDQAYQKNISQRGF